MPVAKHSRSVSATERTAAWLLASVLLGGAACVTPPPGAEPVKRTTPAKTSRATTPEKPESPEETFISTDTMPGRIHIVQRGDTLWSLAEHYYGSGKYLHRIRLANRNRLTDPEDLPVNMKLIIP